MLFIQKVEDNASSEEMTKIVKDKQKVKKILTMIEGLKVKETNSEYVLEQMKSQNTYIFSFSEDENIETGVVPYAFNVLNDGTFIFTHEKVNSLQKPRITTGKHQDLLNEMKQLLEIDF